MLYCIRKGGISCGIKSVNNIFCSRQRAKPFRRTEYLHLSQPTLSRQLKELENELGKQLFIRGNRRITLTEEGMILRKRAEEIMQLVKKTEDEITLADQSISGDIFIGAAETNAVRFISRAEKNIQHELPQCSFSYTKWR